MSHSKNPEHPRCGKRRHGQPKLGYGCHSCIERKSLRIRIDGKKELRRLKND